MPSYAVIHLLYDYIDRASSAFMNRGFASGEYMISRDPKKHQSEYKRSNAANASHRDPHKRKYAYLNSKIAEIYLPYNF